MVEPQIVIDQNYDAQKPSSGWWKSKRFLLGLVAVLVLGEIIWAGYTLTRPVTKDEVHSQTAVSAPEAETSKASFLLLSTNTATVGQNIEVDLDLESNARINGVDVLIKYDPDSLELVNPKAPLQTLVEITISAISNPNEEGVDKGTLGTLSFKTKKSGSTTVSVIYEPNSSKESNVIETKSGRDILNSVTNLNLNIN
jgi:hypothetical protein